MTPQDVAQDALDRLAEALAPRVLKLLREQTQDTDGDLDELLSAAGYEREGGSK